ncbi:unnamed protein product [Paramecium primaurelia]|uniref:Cyclic nucleotide-binding domain-containing protein n=1 Tax=Paramecium primaurelia TaxID=5886 RepID=A0A8S1LSI5_PARPR|nr:unnamed protein product [Paramecium primaurelia]
MSSLSQQFELQHRDSIQESLLNESSIYNQDDYHLESSQSISNGKQFQNKARLAMEERAEKEQQQSQQYILEKIRQLYNDSLEGVSLKLNILYQLPILRPKQIILWKLFINLLTLFVFFEVPVYIAFGQGFWKELDTEKQVAALYYSISLFLVIDMGLDFITAYYKHGVVITDSRKIAINYLYGNFFFDLTALIISIARLSLFTSNFRFIFLMFYFKLPSFLRFDDQLNEMVLLYRRTRVFYEVGKRVIFMFFAFNVFLCVFYIIGLHSVASNYNSWLTNSGNFGIILDRPLHEIYFFGFYFSLGTVSTTMGYGDISPMNIIECSWSLLGVMFGLIIFANNINSFQKMMEEYNLNDLKQFKYKVSINKFMEQKQVSSELQEIIRQYLNEYWHQQGLRDQEQEILVFQMLAPELKQELMYQSYGQFLQTTFFSKYFSKPFLKDLSEKITEVNYSTGNVIIEAGDSNDDQSFYFIQSGTVIIKCGNSEIVKKKLIKGDSFGEFAFMTGQARTATAYSQEYSQLHKISRNDFLDILKHYPDDYEIFCKLRDELIFSQHFQSLGQFCWTCHKFNHYAYSCPFTHYIPEVQDLVENATILNSNQDRMKIQRYDRKHWPTRTNQKTLVNGLNKSKIKKFANVMLKTVKNINMQKQSPLKKQSSIQQSAQSFGLDSESKLEFNKSESIQDDSLKINQQDDGDISQVQFTEQKDVEKNNLSSLQNKLNQYRDQQQYQIHQGLDYFDEPQNFKYYHKKFNYSNYKVFQGFKESQMKKQINIRKSFMPGTYT